MQKKSKEHPSFWFEQPASTKSLMKIDEELHKMLKHPLEARFNFPQFKLSRELLHMMPTDIADLGGELAIKAALPGYDKDKIKLKIGPRTVTISAEQKKQKRDIGKKSFKQESVFGSAHQSFTLPIEVSPDSAKAKYDKGILTIHIKKAKKALEKEKEVKLG